MLIPSSNIDNNIIEVQNKIERYEKHLDKLILDQTTERIFNLIAAYKTNNYDTLLGSNLGTAFLRERFGGDQMWFVWDEQIDYHTLWLKPERDDFVSKPDFSSMTRFKVRDIGEHLKKIRFCIGRFEYDFVKRKTGTWDRDGLFFYSVDEIMDDIIQLGEAFPYVEVRKSV